MDSKKPAPCSPPEQHPSPQAPQHAALHTPRAPLPSPPPHARQSVVARQPWPDRQHPPGPVGPSTWSSSIPAQQPGPVPQRPAPKQAASHIGVACLEPGRPPKQAQKSAVSAQPSPDEQHPIARPSLAPPQNPSPGPHRPAPKQAWLPATSVASGSAEPCAPHAQHTIASRQPTPDSLPSPGVPPTQQPAPDPQIPAPKHAELAMVAASAPSTGRPPKHAQQSVVAMQPIPDPQQPVRVSPGGRFCLLSPPPDLPSSTGGR